VGALGDLDKHLGKQKARRRIMLVASEVKAEMLVNRA